MKRNILQSITLLLLVTLGNSFVQATPMNKTQLIAEWTRAKEYTKSYLETMPAEHYGFKPVPEIRSFAEQMLHLATANYNFIATITGITNPIEGKNLEMDASLQTKDAAMKAVMDSYDFVIGALSKLDESKMGETVNLFGRVEVTRELALAKAFEHQTHHRGQTTIYIRLNGIAPPNERLF